MKRVTSLLVLALLIGNLPIFGQQATRGSLSGEITDQNGAVIGNVAVTAKHQGTGEEIKTQSSEQGIFVFPSLPVGPYSVIAEANGFKRSEVTGIVIEISTPAKIKISLEVGSVSEQVTVSGSVQEIINSSSPVLTNVVTPRQVQDLPLPTRNPLDLARLQAGIATFGTGVRGGNVAGLRESAINITQDGVNVMDNFLKNDSFFAISNPTVESTAEFSVSIGTAASESGRGVAQVRIVTPSGTNEFHGGVFLFHRNDNLNANTFFNNARGADRAIQLQNRFGFKAGGPVYIPKIYDGRNSSFWYVGYQGFREPLSATRSRTVLTAEARRGLFRYIGSNGQLQTVNLLQIGNPIAGSLNPVSMAEIERTPLPNDFTGLVGDTLNQAGFVFNVPGKGTNDAWTFRADQKLTENSAIGSHKLEYVLHRSTFLSTPDFLNNGEQPFPGETRRIQKSTRLNTSAAIHSVFGASMTNEVRFGHLRAPVGFLRETQPDQPFFINFTSFTDPVLRGMDSGRNTTVYHFQDNFSWVRGRHIIRMGAEAQSITNKDFSFGGTLPTVNLGSNAQNSDGIAAGELPFLPSGSLGNALLSRARSIFADITGFLGTASQTFNVSDPTSGFLPGAASEERIRQRDLSLYVQDQWRMRPNLTINAGLRWEYIAVPTVNNGLSLQPVNGVEGLFGISGVGNLFNPGVLKGTSPTPLDFPKDKFYNNDWNNFAPFVGFAYSPDFKSGPMKFLFGSGGSSAIRGGYSISYLRDGISVFSAVISSNPGLSLTPQNANPTGVLTSAGVSVAAPVFKTPLTDLENFTRTQGASGIITWDQNISTPYVQQWSLSIEREIASQTAIEIRYVGNHAIKMWRSFDFNEINIFENGFLNEFLNAQHNLAINRARRINGQLNPLESFAPGLPGTLPLPIFTTLFGSPNSALFRNTGFIGNLDLGSAGVLANTLATNPSFINTRASLAPNFFRANPNATFARLMSDPSWSNYNAIQLELRRRLSNGLFLQGNYTFGRAFTDSEGSASNNESFRTLRSVGMDKHRANFDQTHRFIANFIYELPIGTGRRFLSNGPAPIRKVLEGWQVQGIVNWQSGAPLFFSTNRSTVNNLNAGLNPAVLTGMTIEQFRKNVGIFRTGDGVFFFNPDLLNIERDVNDPSRITSITIKDGILEAAAPGTFGNFPRNSINGPRFFQTDLSLIKRTYFTESANMEIRVEAFNAFNNTNFSFGTQAFDSTSFGQITGTQGGARVIQLGVRVNW